MPRPTYDLGWTLNYEMFFFGLAFPLHNPQLFFWTQPIVLEFILGMCLALLVRGVRVEEKRAARGPRVRPLGQAFRATRPTRFISAIRS